MTKYLLLIALAVVVWWMWRKAQAARSSGQLPSPREAERMVKCARCGVNQPVSESILAGGNYYCCAAHRRDAEAESH